VSASSAGAVIPGEAFSIDKRVRGYGRRPGVQERSISMTHSEGEEVGGWEKTFSNFADKAAFITGKPLVFLAALTMTVAWGASGPLFGWSDAWQLIANTVTNLATFLMVFVIQNSQNRDSAAIQAKLDEVLRTVAPNTDLTGIEDLTQEEINDIKARRARA
jgi:low affinity Fe/Cu permease